MRRAVGWVVVVLAACSPSPGGVTDAGVDRGAPPLCTPGAQVSCPCLAGTAGVQVCLGDGTFGGCTCPDAGVPLDAGDPIDAGDPVDVGALLDLGAPVDLGLDLGAPVDLGRDVPRDTGTPDVPRDAGFADVPRDTGAVDVLRDAGPPPMDAFGPDAGPCGRCAAPNVDEALCGMSPERGWFCFASQCSPGMADCNGNFADGCETNVRSSSAHCSACDRPCPSGQTCFNFRCLADAGFEPFPPDAALADVPRGDAGPEQCGLPRQACTVDEDCAMCAPSFGRPWCCAGPRSRDFGRCVERNTPGICDGYGVPDAGPTAFCASGLERTCTSNEDCSSICEPRRDDIAWCCSFGYCRVHSYPVCPVRACRADRDCFTGQTCCSGGCFSLRSDPIQCGACGVRCAAPHAEPACVAGACAVGTCEAHYADCDGAPANGCETDLRTTFSHCGSCGRTCSGGMTCRDGVCR
ncbi:MAG: hypothetical protein Q8S73_03225 [Deltaproteobacteria bacterium]|nr:hypothetical protein [Myxococcales bacterium]MDP3213092.1 hypothetical protein [Deltaproteobacteria bacterium]